MGHLILHSHLSLGVSISYIRMFVTIMPSLSYSQQLRRCETWNFTMNIDFAHSKSHLKGEGHDQQPHAEAGPGEEQLAQVEQLRVFLRARCLKKTCPFVAFNFIHSLISAADWAGGPRA